MRRDPHNSPLISIASNIIGSAENIAPELASRLMELVTKKRISFVLDDRHGFTFSARTVRNGAEIRASIWGLEFLWALCYAHFTLYQTSKQVQAHDDRFNPATHPRTRQAIVLLHWALNNLVQPAAPWPEGAPKPTTGHVGAQPSDERVATEIFLCACAWILHHEVAHVKLDHIQFGGPNINFEVEADEAATAWILEGASEPDAVLKRGLGVAEAVVSLAALEIHTDPHVITRRPPSHPGSAERIFKAMQHQVFGDDHQVFDYAAHAVKLHLDAMGIAASPGPFETAAECLSEYCLVLSRWKQQ